MNPTARRLPQRHLAEMRAVASTDEIRRHFPALPAMHGGCAGGLLRRPRRHADAAAGGRGDGRLPLPPQRQHPLGVPDDAETDEMLEQSREALADFLNADAGRDHLRRQRHDAGFSCLAGDWAWAVFAGRRDRDHRAGSPCQCRPVAGDRPRTGRHARSRANGRGAGTLDWDDFESKVNSRTQACRGRRRFECPGHDQRRGSGGGAVPWRWRLGVCRCRALRAA